MDINIQETPVDNPVDDLDTDLLEEIIEDFKNEYDEKIDPKLLLNTIYEMSSSRLHKLLDSRNPASWILEAYKQAFMWTLVYKQELHPQQYFSASKNLAPIGRYGWRYAIEYLLAKNSINSIRRSKPHYKDVSEAFTLLAVMSIYAEWSNLIHSFPDVYGDVSFDLSTPHGLLTPILTEKMEHQITERATYMLRKVGPDWEKHTAINRDIIKEHTNAILSRGLQEAKGFTLEQLKKVMDTLLAKVLTSGFVIIIPGGYLIDWVSDEGNIPKGVVSNVFDFITLSSGDLADKKGSFLNKKDPMRMINFAGVRIDRLKNLQSIYPRESLTKSHVKRANWHVIINILMIGDWYDVFIHRCSVGQRQDLKSHPALNRALEDIEQYQRRNVFESVVTDILSKHGLQTIKGLKKWPNEKGIFTLIPCGEIDILAYCDKNKTLFIIECKAVAPATDSRGYWQQKRDYFDQKNYHSKFKSKIDWIEKNKDSLIRLGELGYEIKDCNPKKIIPILVTKFPHIVKFYVNEYKVMTFAELDESIDNIQ